MIPWQRVSILRKRYRIPAPCPGGYKKYVYVPAIAMSWTFRLQNLESPLWLYICPCLHLDLKEGGRFGT